MHARPAAAFGLPHRFFRSKRDAKADVAREAVQWLMAAGHLAVNAAGHVTKRARVAQPAVAPAAATVRSTTSTSTTTTTHDPDTNKSWGQRVNELYPALGFAGVVYDVRAQDAAAAPNMYVGCARLTGGWAGDSVVCAELGTAVYGRKMAKERCAMKAWHWLQDLKQRRIAALESVSAGAGGGREGGVVVDLLA